MSIHAQTPYGTLEFPDGTAPDVIQRTVKSEIAKHKSGQGSSFTDPNTAPNADTQDNSALGSIESGLAGPVAGVYSLGNQVNRLLGLPQMPGTDWLNRQAQRTAGGRVGRFAGQVAPFVAQPELAALEGPGLAATTGRVLYRSALPGALQPTDPNKPLLPQVGRNVVLSTLGGETFQQIAQQAAKPAAAALAETQRVAHENLANRTQYQRDLDAHNLAHHTAVTQSEQRNALAQAEHAHNVSEYQGALPGHTLRMEDWDRQVTARANLDRDMNVQWMRNQLQPLGLAGKAPTDSGDAALNTTRDLIGGKLNEANSKLSFDPAKGDAANVIADTLSGLKLQTDSARSLWDSTIENEVMSPIAERQQAAQAGPTLLGPTGLPLPPTQPQAGWTPKPRLAGKEFASYISNVNQRADSLAREAIRFPNNPDAADKLKMADALHRVSDLVEAVSDGSSSAKRLRDTARASYRGYSILARSADPSKGSVATAKQVVDELERRQGTEQYRANLAKGRSENVFAKQWLDRSMAPAPVKPEPLKGPGAAPTPEAPLKEGKPPAEPATLAPNLRREPSALGRAIRRGVGGLLGYEGARRIGLPGWFGYPGMLTAEYLLHPSRIDPLLAVAARQMQRPGATPGAAATSAATAQAIANLLSGGSGSGLPP